MSGKAAVARIVQATRTPALLVGMLGAFLLPVVTGNLRGVTHLIDCTAPTREAFEVFWTASNRAVITGSSTIEAGDRQGVCDDVDADVAVRPGAENRVIVTVRVTNGRSEAIHATVQIDTGTQRVPVRLGTVGPRTQSSDRVVLRAGRRVTSISTTLLVGP
jgi:hypothetical protein